MKIKNTFLLLSVLACISIFFLQCNSSTAGHGVIKEKYQCIPCGQNCDKDIYDEPGKCTGCQMQLVKKSTVNFKTIEPSEICQYIKEHPDVILLDVRTQDEFEGKADPDFGTLKNAINLPIQQFDAKLSTLDAYKEKEIIVYCSHSHRSPRASYILSQNGFKNVTNLSGGMSVLKDSSCKVKSK